MLQSFFGNFWQHIEGIHLDFSVVPPYSNILLIGLLWTIVITILVSLISFFGGIFIALSLNYTSRTFAWPLKFICWLFMTTPLLIQLYLIYYGLSQLQILLPAFWTGVFVLGFHYAVYNSNIFRTAMNSIDRGQIEASRSLGFSQLQTLRYFITPQSVFIALPQVGNNTIILLKDTSIVSLIGIAELTLNTQRAISDTYASFEFYLAAAALYYIVNLVMEYGLHLVKNKIGVMQ